MVRSVNLLILAAAAAVPGAAQVPVQWIGNPAQGVAQARRTERPILFYVVGSGESSESDFEDVLQAALRNPLVREIAEQRFVPIRLQRSSDNLAMLAGMGAPSAFGNYLAVVTPEGDLIGTIMPFQTVGGAGLAAALARQFDDYRRRVYERDYEPVLEAGGPPDALRNLVRFVREFIVVSADRDLIELLAEPNLPPALRQEIYDTLAVLATGPSTSALFERALAGDRGAQRALLNLPAGAAEYLLDELDSSKPDRMLLAYETLTKIARVARPKSRGFLRNAPEERVQEELERVRVAASRAATRWRDRIEPLR